LVDRDVFDRRLAKLEWLIRELRKVAARGREAFLADSTVQASAERWLHLAAECVLDFAHHVIADRGWKTPETYREAFRILEAEGVLTSERAREMEGWAGLRNVLVHLYLDVDHERLYEILTRNLDQLEAFAAEVSRAVSRPDP
jgi:uncharacterized protein YutE (UPF0331/DUF86 family)